MAWNALLYSIKIKEQTRKLAVGCAKYGKGKADDIV